MANTPTKKKKTPTKKRKPIITKRMKKFAENLAKDMPVKHAALAAGYSENCASSEAYRTADLPQTKKLVEDVRARNNRILERLGMPEAQRLQKFIDLTAAKKVVTASDKGIITDIQEFEDGPLQLNAVKELAKLAGDYPAERHEVEYSGGVELITSVAGPIIDLNPED